MPYGPWDWLEVAKLTVSASIPIAVAALAFYLNVISKRFEHRQWRSQKLIEKRLEIYDDLAPDLNDLLCYFTFIGRWNEIDPPTIVDLKRKIDKKIHLAAPLFSKEFFDAHMRLIGLCFQTYNKWGQGALLKTPFQRRKESHKEWKNEWDTYFVSGTHATDPIRDAYKEIMTAFSNDIGVNAEANIPESGRVPRDIR